VGLALIGIQRALSPGIVRPAAPALLPAPPRGSTTIRNIARPWLVRPWDARRPIPPGWEATDPRDTITPTAVILARTGITTQQRDTVRVIEPPPPRPVVRKPRARRSEERLHARQALTGRAAQGAREPRPPRPPRPPRAPRRSRFGRPPRLARSARTPRYPPRAPRKRWQDPCPSGDYCCTLTGWGCWLPGMISCDKTCCGGAGRKVVTGLLALLPKSWQPVIDVELERGRRAAAKRERRVVRRLYALPATPETHAALKPPVIKAQPVTRACPEGAVLCCGLTGWSCMPPGTRCQACPADLAAQLGF